MTGIGTRLFTLLRGRLIGRDADGRAYYESRKPGGYTARPQRWVIYNRHEDASAVPAEWWNWLHFVEDAPLPPQARKPWQLPFQPNRTGEAGGYHPPGSDYRGGLRPRATGDYESWTPDA
ncbi:MAG: NADH-quinone oxidoreductase subunit D [Gluconacetobacter diazotrophicus]|nr:NADH-quinone oxidoreductase subunit D [Gluconacetobacter diazotrophicus]